LSCKYFELRAYIQMVNFKSKTNILVLAFVLSIKSILAQQYNIDSLKQYYQNKANHYLDLNNNLNSYYQINNDGIEVYANQINKNEGNIERKYTWNEIIKCQQLQMFPCRELNDKLVITSTLKGSRIAIDPGHIAGNMEMGKIESKFISFTKPDSLQFAEGILTLAAAQLLKKKLEQEGAIVMLTRNNSNYTAFNKTFDDWLKYDFNKTVDSLNKRKIISVKTKNILLSPNCSKRDKFKLLFRDLELAKRAEIINKFNPDITIVIHFNVDEQNSGWRKPSVKNYNMAFMPGAFTDNDLQDSAKRYHFTRLLVTNNLETSLALSKKLIQSFEAVLKVKAASVNDAEYLSNKCKSTDEVGVYCRNLFLTRVVKGTIAYGETLYQDNETECLLLSKEEDKKNNERVKEVAEAYYQGIKNYFEHKNKP
jgi:N-acetylmuramoyl-L-alanine amidase